MFASVAIAGFCVSLTVTVNEQGADRLFAASRTVQVTVVVPFAKTDPDGGTQTGVPAPEQLSVACGAKLTTAEHKFVSVPLMMFAGQVIAGFCVSLTVTVNVQLRALFEVSVAVQLTVVVPLANGDPDGGEQLTLALPQLSVAAGVVKLIIAEH
jgi:hypothetical protein